MNLSDSLLIEITRGSMVESTHNCDVVVADAGGDIISVWGRSDRMIYARSSLKPVQALPLLETGAADRFNCSEAEIAFACSSHSSEDIHTATAADILNRIGLSESSLECGPHRPYLESHADHLIKTGAPFTRLHNNCSGKHAGFLATARHVGDDPAGYIRFGHPVQGRITEAMCDMTGYDLVTSDRGADGCGIPVLAMPLSALAIGMAKMADPAGLGETRENAAHRIVHAMVAHPHMVAGAGRVDTAAMLAMDGRVAMKGGAEGVHIAIVPERGLGIALKAHCGSKRAAEPAIMWVLKHLGFISDSAAGALGEWLNPVIINTLGNTVGHVRVAQP